MDTREQVGESFCLDAYLKARKKALGLIALFTSQLKADISEKEGIGLLENLCKENGIQKFWHPTKFRIASNTQKSFKEISEANIILKENDIYFIDLGAVIDGYETDIGRSYIHGENNQAQKMIKDTAEMFFELQKTWFQENLSGTRLYKKAKTLAQEKNYFLNEKMAGHRLGDFPHALYHKGSLADFEKKPIENLWVLELHLLNSSSNMGVFYEDILTPHFSHN